MASGLIFDDEGRDITMDTLTEAVEKTDEPRVWRFGNYVSFCRVLQREYGDETADRQGWKKIWHVKQGNWTPGIVIGVRTLSDGENAFMGQEGIDYTPTRYFKAYLVAFDMRRKPVFILPEDLKDEFDA